MRRLKYWIKKISPVALSKNHRYDRLTYKIVQRYCAASSNCIDVGSHEGEFLKLFHKIAPKGNHFGFEPIPHLYENLSATFSQYPGCKIFNYALSNEEGQINFNYVITNPAYSGIKKRKYDRPTELDETITVTRKKMDTVIPENVKIDFIKIDVEGGEFDVLLGAERIISHHHPLIIFEFGIGGSDVYGISAEDMFKLMTGFGYKISLLQSFLKRKKVLNNMEFSKQVKEKINYYFIAHQ